jgi:hypothetical protein
LFLPALRIGESNMRFSISKDLESKDGKDPEDETIMPKKLRITSVEAIVMLNKPISNYSRKRQQTETDAVNLFLSGMDKSETVQRISPEPFTEVMVTKTPKKIEVNQKELIF